MMGTEPAAVLRHDHIDWGQLAGAIRRGWRLLAVSVCVTLTLAGLYLAAAKRQYQATARLLVLQHGGRPLSVAETDPNRLLEGTEDYIPTQSLILSSPRVVGSAIKQVGLDALPTLAAVARRGDDPVEFALKRLKVSRPDRMAKILQAEFRAGSPAEAVRFLEALLASYEQFLDSTMRSKSHEIVGMIEKARDELDRELRELEQGYQAFRREHSGLNPDDTGRTLSARRLERWDAALDEAMVQGLRLKTQLELGRALARGGTELWAIAHALGEIGGDPSSLQAMLAAVGGVGGSIDYVRQLEHERERLSEQFGVGYAKVRELQEQIDSIRDRAREIRAEDRQGEVHDLITAMEMGVRSLESLREAYASRLEAERQRVGQEELVLLQDENLRGELERRRMLFNTVIDQLKQAQFVGDYSSLTVETIQSPYAPSTPARPVAWLVLAVGVLGGLALGGMAAIVVDRVGQRIHSIEELRDTMGSPVLGQIPRLGRGDEARARGFGRISHVEPRSPWSEGFRAVRTNVDLLRQRGDLRVLMVSSARAGEGKSSLSSNLAISLAQAGRRVLLIDADLRKPTQHRVHGVRREPGLSEVLRDGRSLGMVAQPTAVEGLDLVVAGAEPPNPAELLVSPRLAGFLAEARGLYDIVIVDSAPLLPVADSSIIGPLVDCVILVAQASRLRRPEARRLRELVDGIGVPLLGVVANRVGREHGGYGYGYGYGESGRDGGARRPGRGATEPPRSAELVLSNGTHP
jgi:capsular exopolysaccharide synthesis family protein